MSASKTSRPKMEVIDSIMERKIGFGTYQKKALGFLCLIDFNDGLELVLMSITLPIIRKEWNEQYSQQTILEGGEVKIEEYITTFIFKWLGSIFFLGNLIGALLTGYLSDKFGRRQVILCNSLAYGLIACSFLFVQNLWQLFTLRFLYGFVYGITLPLSTTYYAEITPTKMRGRGVVIINSAIAIGQITGVIISSLVLTNISSGNWRLLISLASIPAFILFYGTYTFLLESPRYLICNKQLEDAADVMNQMVSYNRGDGGEVVTDDEIAELEKWRQRKYNHPPQEIFNSSKSESSQVGTSSFFNKIVQMFKSKYLLISISLCIQWFGIHFMSIGQIFILPLVSAQAKKGFFELFLTFLGEVPGFLLTYLIIDRPQFGRKNSLIIFFLVAAATNFFAFGQIIYAIALGLSRLSYRQCHGVLYVLTNEIYETPLRSTAMGLTSALGRFATVIMPFILVPLCEANTYSPFLCFTFIGIICSFMAYKLPFDTSNLKLDHVDEELGISSPNLSIIQPLLKN